MAQPGKAALDKWQLISPVGRAGLSVPLRTFEELLQGTGNDGSRANPPTAACTPWDILYSALGAFMSLSTQESTMLEAFRRLPSDTAIELSTLIHRLASLNPNSRVDWSDAWSDEDLRNFTSHALHRLDAEEDLN